MLRLGAFVGIHSKTRRIKKSEPQTMSASSDSSVPTGMTGEYERTFSRLEDLLNVLACPLSHSVRDIAIEAINVPRLANGDGKIALFYDKGLRNKLF